MIVPVYSKLSALNFCNCGLLNFKIYPNTILPQKSKNKMMILKNTGIFWAKAIGKRMGVKTFKKILRLLIVHYQVSSTFKQADFLSRKLSFSSQQTFLLSLSLLLLSGTYIRSLRPQEMQEGNRQYYNYISTQL